MDTSDKIRIKGALFEGLLNRVTFGNPEHHPCTIMVRKDGTIELTLEEGDTEFIIELDVDTLPDPVVREYRRPTERVVDTRSEEELKRLHKLYGYEGY